MADRGWPPTDIVRSLISQLDEAVQNAERVRREVEAQMRRRAEYPDCQQPRHWQRLPTEDTATSDHE